MFLVCPWKCLLSVSVKYGSSAQRREVLSHSVPRYGVKSSKLAIRPRIKTAAVSVPRWLRPLGLPVVSPPRRQEVHSPEPKAGRSAVKHSEGRRWSYRSHKTAPKSIKVSFFIFNSFPSSDDHFKLLDFSKFNAIVLSKRSVSCF